MNLSSSSKKMILFRNTAAVFLGVVVLGAGIKGCLNRPRPEAEDIKSVRAEVAETAKAKEQLTTDSSNRQWKLTVTGSKREYSVSPKTNGLSFSVQRKK
jgi:hypothetical protein